VSKKNKQNSRIHALVYIDAVMVLLGQLVLGNQKKEIYVTFPFAMKAHVGSKTKISFREIREKFLSVVILITRNEKTKKFAKKTKQKVR
jgi:hypothetical protein